MGHPAQNTPRAGKKRSIFNSPRHISQKVRYQDGSYRRPEEVSIFGAFKPRGGQRRRRWPVAEHPRL
jgi:hypothetical protein